MGLWSQCRVIRNVRSKSDKKVSNVLGSRRRVHAIIGLFARFGTHVTTCSKKQRLYVSASETSLHHYVVVFNVLNFRPTAVDITAMVNCNCAIGTP